MILRSIESKPSACCLSNNTDGIAVQPASIKAGVHFSSLRFNFAWPSFLDTDFIIPPARLAPLSGSLSKKR